MEQMTLKELKKYLDSAIDQWREAAERANNPHTFIAKYYIDAYQSIRKSVFGETKA